MPRRGGREPLSRQGGGRRGVGRVGSGAHGARTLWRSQKYKRFFVLGRRLHRSPSPRGGSAKRGAMRRCLWRSEKPEKGAKMPPPVKDSGFCRAKDGGAAGPREGDKRNLCSAIERPVPAAAVFLKEMSCGGRLLALRKAGKGAEEKGKAGAAAVTGCKRLQQSAPCPTAEKQTLGPGGFEALRPPAATGSSRP